MTLGTPVTQRMAGEGSNDPRDAFTAQERETAYAALHAERKGTAALPVVRRGKEFWMIHGEVGSGKSLVGAHMARQAYRQGRDVFSNAGLLFGRRMSLMPPLAQLLRTVPNQAVLFLDEALAPCQSYRPDYEEIEDALEAAIEKDVRLLLKVADPARVYEPIRKRAGCVSVTQSGTFTVDGCLPTWAYLRARWIHGSETGTLRLEPRELFEAAKLLDVFGAAQ